MRQGPGVIKFVDIDILDNYTYKYGCKNIVLLPKNNHATDPEILGNLELRKLPTKVKKTGRERKI